MAKTRRARLTHPPRLKHHIKAAAFGGLQMSAPLIEARRRAARMSMPNAGIKQVGPSLLAAWGRNADMVMRLRLIDRGALNLALEGLDVATRRAIVCAPVQHHEEDWENMPHPLDMRDTDTQAERDLKWAMKAVQLGRDMMLYRENALENHLLFTPIRSLLHIEVLRVEQKLQRHMWARFLDSFLPTNGDECTDLFTPAQTIAATHYELRLVYRIEELQDAHPFVQLTIRTQRNLNVTQYFIYDDAGAELEHLQNDMAMLMLKI